MKRQNSRNAAKKKADRTVTKKCQDCSQECPVARKSCECGYQFPTRTRTVTPKSEPTTSAPTPSTSASKTKAVAEDPELTESKRRRFRTKRMRPDFFNPLDMEYSSRRKVTEVKKKRGRPKGSLNKPNKPKPEPEQKPSPPPEDENMFANLPSEKLLQFNIILQELNHKFTRQNFKPQD